MTDSKLLRLYRGLEALYGTRTGVNPSELLLPFSRSRDSTTPREILLMEETDEGELKVGLAVDEQLLRHLEASTVDDALSDQGLGHTLPVLEGLSHLMYVAEAARCERPVSGLELETQAEVDKLAVCLLHRWTTARRDFPILLDRLFFRFRLAPQKPEHQERYLAANRIALGFARRLRPHVEARQLHGMRRTLRSFWRAPLHGKMALSRAS